MVPIGGAGPVHAPAIALKLGIARLVVPPGAGVASAFGFLAAPISFAFLRGQVAALDTLDFDELRATIGGMEAEGRAMLRGAGVAEAITRITAAMRYAGQGYGVEALVPDGALAREDRAALRAAFEGEYRRLYGRVEPGLKVECVGWRVTVSGPTPKLDLAATAPVGAAAGKGRRRAWFGGGFVDAAVFDRAALKPGDALDGPALVEERESTLVLPPGARATCDAALNLVVELPVTS
jgi:N-methylhydantoinase A